MVQRRRVDVIGVYGRVKEVGHACSGMLGLQTNRTSDATKVGRPVSTR